MSQQAEEPPMETVAEHVGEFQVIDEKKGESLAPNGKTNRRSRRSARLEYTAGPRAFFVTQRDRQAVS
eukprot:5462516-Pyramimonas_sp.AAC.1